MTMHIISSKRDLLPALERCRAVSESKSTMPILAHVLLAADNDGFTLSATDLTLAVKATVQAQIVTTGSVSLPARDLLDRVRNMPDGEIGISVKGTEATIRAVCSSRRFKLQGVPGDEFPALPAPDAKVKGLKLNAETLAGLIAGTSFSISQDETRPHLNSALLECNGVARMVTTDGHRLSKMEAATKLKADSKLLIPLKGVAELRRLCEEAGEDTELTLTESGACVFFDLPCYRLSVKLMDSQFPPYQQVIPAESAHKVRAPRGGLAEALTAVSVAASDRTGGVKLSLAKGKLTIESQSPEGGDGFDELAVDYDGPRLAVGFNAKYMSDVLRAIESEDVDIALGGELDPLVVTPVGSGEGQLYVVMPMRI